MFPKDRSDGKLVRNAPLIRLFTPYIMARRGDAVGYVKQKIDVSQTRPYLKRWNDGTRPRIRLYHVYVAACVRMLGERPRVNRFIAGRRIYQREDVAISMSVLPSRDKDAELSVVKQTYYTTEGLTAIKARTDAIIATGSASERTDSEKLMALVARFPRWMIPILLRLEKLGEWLNLTPAGMVANDPLYASMMISFNGPVGLDSVYHHLYEHGTVPIFSSLGPVRDEAVVTRAREIEIRPIMTVRHALDLRPTDGHYGADALKLLKKYVEQPWLLEKPEDNGPGKPLE